MPLPNPGMTFTPFDVLPASDLNDIVENIEALQDGSSAAVTTNISKNLLTTDSNPYKFSVYRNAGANTGSGAFAIIAFDTELFDTNNNFNTGTGIYTTPVNGFYHFDFACLAAMSGATQSVVTAIFVNGNIKAVGSRSLSPSASSLGSSGSKLIQLTAGDTVEVRVFGSVAGAIAVTEYDTYFTGYLISKT